MKIQPNFYQILVEVFNAGLPILIPALALWIGYLQYRLSKRKTKVDEFSMKYAIYSDTEDFIHKIMSGWITVEECVDYEKKVRKALFIYSDKINEFINEILKKGFDLASLNSDIKAYQGSLTPEQIDQRKKLMHEKSELLKEGLEFRNRLRSMFEGSLKIS